MQQVVLIARDGAAGALARYRLSTLVYHATSGGFLWGTRVVNLTGCSLIGSFVKLFGTEGLVTLDNMHVFNYRHSEERPGS